MIELCLRLIIAVLCPPLSVVGIGCLPIIALCLISLINWQLSVIVAVLIIMFDYGERINKFFDRHS